MQSGPVRARYRLSVWFAEALLAIVAGLFSLVAAVASLHDTADFSLVGGLCALWAFALVVMRNERDRLIVGLICASVALSAVEWVGVSPGKLGL